MDGPGWCPLLPRSRVVAPASPFDHSSIRAAFGDSLPPPPTAHAVRAYIFRFGLSRRSGNYVLRFTHYVSRPRRPVLRVPAIGVATARWIAAVSPAKTTRRRARLMPV